MKLIKENLRPLMLMLLIPAMSLSYLLINKFSGSAHDITIHLDSYIPLMKIFVIPYIIWYLFVPVSFLLLCLKDKRVYYKSILVYSLGCIIASIIFILYQTTVPRTQIYGNDVLTKIMLLIYANDKPVNCLPSIHVFTCYLIMRAVPVSKLKGFRNNLITAFFSITIILSTLFTKQHALLDVLSGILLAETLIFLVNRYEDYLLELTKKDLFSFFHKQNDLKPE
jgi:membrane-associated phospholipid phosphatase